ncbi:uncharacterized protein LOC133185928 [Saccostrea echinata]|uniref:uncharacterized protein LOC133185928 n=1 Tax=Saccostrea echinata TaxID=191078 RepID=UPI002A81B768|nr:uncharacterized protein LOC133185928 [Saccostrea echinata]
MEDFVGRIREIRDISHILFSPSSTKRAVILYGLKAVGKSSVIRQICSKVKDFQVYSADLRNAEEPIKNLEFLFSTILNERKHLPDEENMEEVFEKLLEKLCSELKVSKTKYLIALYNIEGVIEDGRSKYLEKVFHLVVNLDNVRILATSTAELEVNHPQVFEMVLDPLSLKDSQDMLRKLCPSLKNDEKFYKIVDLCMGLPLALKMVATEIAAGILTVEDIVYLLSQCRLKLLSQEYYPSTDRLAPIYLTFLQRLSEPLQEKLSMINYIPGTFNEREAMEMMGRECSDIEDLKTVIKHHIIHKNSNFQRLDIHGILRDCITEYILIKDLPVVRIRFCKVFSEILQELENRTFTYEYQAALCQLNLEQQNFNKLFTDVFHCTGDTYENFVNIASFEFNMATPAFVFNSPETYEMGMVFYQECLRLTRKQRNEYDASRVLIGWGRVVTNIKGDYILGEKHYRSALRIRECAVGKSDFSLALLYQGLGWNLGCQGKSQEAITFLERALSTELELGMNLENLILNTFQTLALFHLDLDHMEIGEKYQKEALRRRRLAIGTDIHPIMGSMINNVGEMYLKKADLEQAEIHFRRGLEIKIQTNAAVKSIVLSEINLANLMTDTERVEDAFDLLHSSLNRIENLQGIYKDVKSLVHESFGKAYTAKENYTSASHSFRKAIECLEDSQPSDLGLLNLQCELAESLTSLAKYEEAINVIESSLRNKEEAIKNNPSTLVVLRCYNIIRKAQIANGLAPDAQESEKLGLVEFTRLNNLFQDLKNKRRLKILKKESELYVREKDEEGK